MLDPAIADSKAALAYENALGSMMADQMALKHQDLAVMMEDMADFLESVGVDGLEAPLLSGLFGLENGRHRTTLERLTGVLRNSPIKGLVAGGTAAFPVVDRFSGRLRFYETDAVQNMLNSTESWLGGVNAGMGGVGGFGYGAGGPVFNAFASSIADRSTDSDVEGFCQAFGEVAGSFVVIAGAGVGTMIGVEIGALIGSAAGPPGALFGAGIFGMFLGQVGGALAIQAWEYAGGNESATQACEERLGADDKKMPSPDSAETGLKGTEVDIALALARLNAAKRPAPDQETIMVGEEPVIVDKLQTVIYPQPEKTNTPGWAPPPDDIWVIPRPGNPLMGRTGSLLKPGATRIQVTEDRIEIGFARPHTGEFVPEVRGATEQRQQPGSDPHRP